MNSAVASVDVLEVHSDESKSQILLTRYQRRLGLPTAIVFSLLVTLALLFILSPSVIESFEKKVHYRVSLRSLGNSISIVAGDALPVGVGFVLRNESNGYVLDLGNWSKSQEVEFPAAFGLVNLESENMRLSAFTFASMASAWDVVVHENESKRTVLGDPMGLDGGRLPADSCDLSGGTASLWYYRAGTGLIDHSRDGFAVDNITSGDGYRSGLARMTYHIDFPERLNQRTADRMDAGYRAVMADPPTEANVDTKCGSGQLRIASLGGTQSNLVWVSLAKRAGQESIGDLTLELFFKSLGTG